MTLAGSKPGVKMATAALQRGPLMHAPFVKSVTVSAVVMLRVATLLRSRHVGAPPESKSESLTAVCKSLTAVLLERSAVLAMIGPPAARLAALKATLPELASMVPGTRTPAPAIVMPPDAVAVTAPPKLLLGDGSAMLFVPALMVVVPPT